MAYVLSYEYFQTIKPLKDTIEIHMNLYYNLKREDLSNINTNHKIVPLKLKLTRKQSMKSSLLMMAAFAALSTVIEISSECKL